MQSEKEIDQIGQSYQVKMQIWPREDVFIILRDKDWRCHQIEKEAEKVEEEEDHCEIGPTNINLNAILW